MSSITAKVSSASLKSVTTLVSPAVLSSNLKGTIPTGSVVVWSAPAAAASKFSIWAKVRVACSLFWLESCWLFVACSNKSPTWLFGTTVSSGISPDNNVISKSCSLLPTTFVWPRLFTN